MIPCSIHVYSIHILCHFLSSTTYFLVDRICYLYLVIRPVKFLKSVFISYRICITLTPSGGFIIIFIIIIITVIIIIIITIISNTINMIIIIIILIITVSKCFSIIYFIIYITDIIMTNNIRIRSFIRKVFYSEFSLCA
jgi:hypothetical protein